MATIFVDVVSAEESIFSGEASFVALPGQEGELGILPGHVPLLTRIRPGAVRITTTEGTQENVFVAGGILEVQPDRVTVLADTAIRSKDLDEAKAKQALEGSQGEAGARRSEASPRQGAEQHGDCQARSDHGSIGCTDRLHQAHASLTLRNGVKTPCLEKRPFQDASLFLRGPSEKRPFFFSFERDRSPSLALGFERQPLAARHFVGFNEKGASRWMHKTLRM